MTQFDWSFEIWDYKPEKCTKCGCPTASIEWHKSARDTGCYFYNSQQPDAVGEHLHVTCDTCRHQWIEPTLEQKEAERDARHAEHTD